MQNNTVREGSCGLPGGCSCRFLQGDGRCQPYVQVTVVMKMELWEQTECPKWSQEILTSGLSSREWRSASSWVAERMEQALSL